MTPDTQLLLLIALSLWLVGSSAVRLRLRFRRAKGTPLREEEINLIRPTCQVAGSICLALALWLGAGLFVEGKPLLGTQILAVSLVISGCADPVADLLWPTERSRRFWIPLVQAFGLGIAGVALLGFVLYLRSVPGPDNEAVRAHWPLEGRWRVVTGGRHRLTNYHSGRASNQTLAVDFVIDGPRNASMGQPVFAPVSGVVVRAVGHLRLGDDPAGGNEVAIQTDEGILVTLAHLATDSVLVAEGDRVQSGQEIAAVGNSGNADEAHLHIQAERGSVAVPILFGPERHWPLRHQIVNAVP